ncbi:2-methylisocitrate lyase-like PEP mutase family enzyme [Kineococcus radiotolerans]|uniref:2-methylisocitrate lyase-like PEP mutase family enzyme n=1 Tax=Kineococcus radiotolerans TaxID=131568 RepID=A0A7W4TPS9_KINRA|nr:isocitrate lyase/phosphoenolpyruvate mutase family protein [Kineococcus radiotolerans]MBB2902879.1 2-methylisocitrate lyase-like PEP mutase family enzyme [Kineococcus radiotolerans]
MNSAEKAARLRQLHEDPELLVLVNVWDAVSATVVAGEPRTRALATAGHSIAATFGYGDGEQIPLDLALSLVERIVVAAGDLPVSADLDGGFGNAGETVRKAIGVGVVGANVEDQLRPLAESVANVEAIVAAGEAEGVPFVLNARTDALVRGGDRGRDVWLPDAIERGRAYLAAGATSVFVPGPLDEDAVQQLVAAFGPQKLSVIGFPGVPDQARLAELGVARITYGPLTQRVALTALQDAARGIYAGGGIPEGTRPLN